MAIPQFDRLANIQEAAAFLNTSVEALRVQRYRGQKPGNLAVLVGKKLLWSPDTMREWFAGRESERQSAGFVGGEQERQNVDAG